MTWLEFGNSLIFGLCACFWAWFLCWEVEQREKEVARAKRREYELDSN